MPTDAQSHRRWAPQEWNSTTIPHLVGQQRVARRWLPAALLPLVSGRLDREVVRDNGGSPELPQRAFPPRRRSSVAACDDAASLLGSRGSANLVWQRRHNTLRHREHWSGKAASQVPVTLEAWSDVNKRMPKLSTGSSSKLWVSFRFRACLFGAVEVDGAISSAEVR